jgi:anti-sigma B factor antagonist
VEDHARDRAAASRARRVTDSVLVERGPGYDVVTPHGDLDVFSSSRLRSVVFDPSSCSQGALVVDLSEVTFLDARALGVLLATRRWTHARSAELVVVVEPGSFVARILAAARLDAVFQTVGSRDEAASRLGRPVSLSH